MSEPLPDDLRTALAASADRRGVFGEPVIFFAETGSTNDLAVTLAEHGAREGAMAIAAAQTAGRGRLGKDWFSPAGAGLYVSIVCRNARAAPLLTLGGGVAVADGIRQATGLPVVLKWPNDVVIPDPAAPGRRRKIAGVLAEGSTGRDGLQYVVLGFGVNLRPVTYPPSIAARTTSVEAELGRTVERGAVLAETLSAFNKHATALAEGQTSALFKRWRELAPSAVGARVEWTVNGLAHRGTTAGIDDQGALLVREQNQTARIIAGEVNWI